MSNWSWLCIDSKPLLLKKAGRLFDQGTQVEKMYFVMSGRVKLVRHPADGEGVVLHVATAGEMIAEASLFSETYHCSAIADQPSELGCIDRKLALERILDNAQTSQSVMRLFAQQIRDLRGLHELRNIRSAQNRVFSYLTAQANDSGEITLNMSLKDMAYKLGLAHETLYRELHKLEKNGKIARPAPGEIVLRK